MRYEFRCDTMAFVPEKNWNFNDLQTVGLNGFYISVSVDWRVVSIAMSYRNGKSALQVQPKFSGKNELSLSYLSDTLIINHVYHPHYSPSLSPISLCKT